MSISKKVIIALLCFAPLCYAFGQEIEEGAEEGVQPLEVEPPSVPESEPSPEPEAEQTTMPDLTTVLGVSVGMDMEQTLAALQSRAKRFHDIPQIVSSKDSLSLLTDLIVPTVRLGWQENEEMIAAGVMFTFYKGKVVSIAISGLPKGESTYSKRNMWRKFLVQIPKTSETIGSSIKAINETEGCYVDDDVLRLYDIDNWNAFIREKKRLEEFFKEISRVNEVLD